MNNVNNSIKSILFESEDFIPFISIIAIESLLKESSDTPRNVCQQQNNGNQD